MSDLVERARKFAAKAHTRQMRKYTNEMYITHPAAVVDILRGAGIEDETTLAAAWLHDTVEDCGVSTLEIASNFGVAVAVDVWMLTDPPTVVGGPNRAARKAASRERLKTASTRVHNIKCADMLDNGSSIAQHDPNFAVLYMREFRLLLPCLYMASDTLKAQVEEMLDQYNLSQEKEDRRL